MFFITYIIIIGCIIDKHIVLSKTLDFYTYTCNFYAEISSCNPHVDNMFSVTVVKLAQTDIPDYHTSYFSSTILPTLILMSS